LYGWRRLRQPPRGDEAVAGNRGWPLSRGGGLVHLDPECHSAVGIFRRGPDGSDQTLAEIAETAFDGHDTAADLGRLVAAFGRVVRNRGDPFRNRLHRLAAFDNVARDFRSGRSLLLDRRGNRDGDLRKRQ